MGKIIVQSVKKWDIPLLRFPLEITSYEFVHNKTYKSDVRGIWKKKKKERNNRSSEKKYLNYL